MFSEHVCQSCQGSTSHRSCKRAASVQCSACTRARLDYQKLEHGKWDICGAYPWPDLPEGRVLLVALPPLSHAYGHSSCGDAHGGHKCTQRDGHLCATPCAGALCFFLLGLACRLAAKVNGLSHFYLSEFAIVILSAQHCHSDDRQHTTARSSCCLCSPWNAHVADGLSVFMSGALSKRSTGIQAQH